MVYNGIQWYTGGYNGIQGDLGLLYLFQSTPPPTLKPKILCNVIYHFFCFFLTLFILFSFYDNVLITLLHRWKGGGQEEERKMGGGRGRDLLQIFPTFSLLVLATEPVLEVVSRDNNMGWSKLIRYKMLSFKHLKVFHSNNIYFIIFV